MGRRSFEGSHTSVNTDRGEGVRSAERPSRSPDRLKTAREDVLAALRIDPKRAGAVAVVLASGFGAGIAYERTDQIRADVAAEIHDASKANIFDVEERIRRDAGIAHERKRAGLPSYEQMLRELAEVIGEDRVNAETPLNIEEMIPAVRTVRQNAERAQETAHVEGFEEAYGVRSETMKRILAETFPRGWSNVGSIAVMQAVPLSELPPNAVGVCRGGREKEPAVIQMWNELPIQELMRLVVHEATHANSSETANVMDPKLRVELLYRTHQRVRSKDRPRFDYVEDWITERDPHERYSRKIAEYLAKLQEVAMMTPADSEELWRDGVAQSLAMMAKEPGEAAATGTLEDVDLALDVLRASDPEFKPWEAAMRRDQLFVEEMRTHAHAAFENEIAQIPSGTMRSIVQHRLDHRPSASERVAARLVNIHADDVDRKKMSPDIAASLSTADREAEARFARETAALTPQSVLVYARYQRLTRTIEAFERFDALGDPIVTRKTADATLTEMRAFERAFRKLSVDEQRALERACVTEETQTERLVRVAERIDGGMSRLAAEYEAARPPRTL